MSDKKKLLKMKVAVNFVYRLKGLRQSVMLHSEIFRFLLVHLWYKAIFAVLWSLLYNVSLWLYWLACAIYNLSIKN